MDTKGDHTDGDEESKKLALIIFLKGTGIIGGIIQDRKGNFYLDRGNGEEPLDDIIG